MEKNIKFSQKTYKSSYHVTINSTTGHIQKRNKISMSRRPLKANVNHIIICNIQDTESTKVSKDGWMDK
jgi:plasmid rolling circle replication initiator protein Rep